LVFASAFFNVDFKKLARHVFLEGMALLVMLSSLRLKSINSDGSEEKCNDNT
jgi:hypothetical protein